MAIEFLDDIEHIRKRPGMYIGTTDTIYPLVREILDNAIDEVINGFGTNIEISYDTKSHTVTVKDDGRGIPINENGYRDIPVLLATKLFSGGKFDDKLYTVTTGLHGVGLTVVNALSSYLKIMTKKKQGKWYQIYEFSNSKLITNRKIKRSDKWSTIIEFVPNEEFIGLDLEKSDIRERLEALKAEYPNVHVKFLWNGKEVKLKDLDTWFVNKKTDLHVKFESKNVRGIIGYSLSETQKFYYGIVNTLPVHRGTHIQEIEKHIKHELFKLAQKEKRHIKENDILIGLRVFIALTLLKVEFAGQHKAELSVKSEELSKLISKINVARLFSKEQLQQIFDKIEGYRLSLEAKKAVRTKKSSSIVHVEGLRDVNDSLPVEERELFLVEGESAGGTAITVRDVSKHAILPLRGKIKNPTNISKAMQNDVIQKIFQALGVKPLQNDLKGLRYGKVLILTDPDADGYHIALLLVAMFELLFPTFVKEGRLYVVQVPLYGKTKGDKFIPIFDERKVDLNDKHIHRFKGLGEMDPHELYTVALDDKSRRLLKVEHSKNIIKVMNEK